MTKRSVLCFILLFAFDSVGDGLKDALGRQVTSEAKAVVSLSPAITEVLYSMGLGDKIIGVSDFSDFPKEAKSKPHVGAYTNPSLEQIVALKPDLVILPKEGPEDIRVQMDRLPLPYATVSMRKIAEIGQTGAMVASWVGETEKGKKFKEDWENKITHLFANRKPTHLRVLIEIQSEPLIAAGEETFLDEMVTKCGALNVIGEKGYPHVALESLVKKKVDLIFLDDYFASAKEKDRAKARWKKFPSTENAKVFFLDPDVSARPGPRLIEGIEKICTIIKEQSF